MQALLTVYVLKPRQEEHQCFISVNDYVIVNKSKLTRVRYLNYNEEQCYERRNKLDIVIQWDNLQP